MGVAAEVGEVLISEDQIQHRIAELAAEINTCYAGRSPLLIGVLNGAVIFMADLVRQLSDDANFEFMAVSSYGDDTESSGVVQIRKDLDTSIAGRDILIVEDIIDSGLTMRYLRDLLEQRSPREICTVALFRKQRPEAQEIPVEWVGFEIPDIFVVGYGLDYAGRFRSLPYLATLKLNNDHSQSTKESRSA